MKFSVTLTLLLLWFAAALASAAPQPTPRSRAFHFPPLFKRTTPTPTPVPRQVAPAKKPTPPVVPPRARPAPTPMVALPNYDEATSVRLQVFLDNHGFGPGKIDGKMGEFFRKALISYKKANGMEQTGAVDAALLDQVREPYTRYTIRPEDMKFVGATASKPSEQAKLKALNYGSVLEFVCERFHAAEEFIRQINAGINFDRLKPGDTLNVPNVQPFEVEKLTEGSMPDNPAHAGRKVVIDTHERFLEIHDESDKIVAEFPITPGSSTLPAPIGTWKILGIAVLPWFRHDEGVLNGGVVTDKFFNLPAGPNNPVGILWVSLSKPHVGVHGTNNPETIGRAASHGCIRTANWDAARIKDLVTKGCVVEIF